MMVSEPKMVVFVYDNAHRESKVFRDQAEKVVCGCSQEKVSMMLIGTRFPRESSKGEELIHLFFILL